MSNPLFVHTSFSRTDVSRDRSSWHGAAFVFETMLLVAFIAASLAVLAAVFSGAQMRGIEAVRLTDAVTLAASGASNGAEDFAADPEAAYAEGASTTYYAVAAGSVSACDPSAANACEVTRVVERRDTAAGALYDATITVTRDGEVMYELETSAYVSDCANDAASDAAAASDGVAADAAAPDAATASDVATASDIVTVPDSATASDAAASAPSPDEGGR